MNFEQLKSFVLVAEYLNFARAAEALYITQPAVTKQINSLEQELGIQLLKRTTRHVELTQAGMNFYADAKDIVNRSQNAVARVKKQNKNTTHFSVATTNSVLLFYIADILKRFNATHPTITPSIELLDYKTASSLFMDDKLDLLFYYKENMPNRFRVVFTELKKDGFSCLLPCSHPFASLAEIPIDLLADQDIIACNPLNAPFAHASFQKQLLQGHDAARIHYCNTVEISHCMVKAEMGICIFPTLLCMKSKDFAVVPLQSKNSVSFGTFRHKNDCAKYIREFIELGVQVFRI